MNIRRLGSVSLGHMSVDIMSSSIAMILTAVSGSFELTISQIGLGAMIIVFASALTQPIFGAWADKLRGRWLGAAGLLWYALFFFISPFAPTYLIMLTCLTLGALGSAAIHTTGMVVAPDAGGSRPTTATSIFFVFGQTGLAIGPIIAGFILKFWGISGIPFIAIGALPVVVLMFFYLRDPVRYIDDGATSTTEHHQSPQGNKLTSGWIAVAIFMLLILLRSATAQTYMTYLPKYLGDLGYTSDSYGLMIGTFVFGGAIGTLIGGYLGDKFNRRMVIFTSLVLSIPFCLLMLGSAGWSFYLAAFVAGGLLNISHSIIIVIGQALMPKQKGMMSGVTLGFMFASGSIMAWISGIAADLYGLASTMYVLALVPIVGALVALLLPSTRQGQIEQAITPSVSGD